MYVKRALFELEFALRKSHGSGRDLAASFLHISSRLAYGTIIASKYLSYCKTAELKNITLRMMTLKDLDAASNDIFQDETS